MLHKALLTTIRDDGIDKLKTHCAKLTLINFELREFEQG
jgi:hypothetical protein